MYVNHLFIFNEFNSFLRRSKIYKDQKENNK